MMPRQVDTRKVREVMTTAPVTVKPTTSVAELKALFEAHDFNAFPVVDEEGVLCGMVTKLDLFRMFRPARRRWFPDPAVWAERVEDIMNWGVISVEPDDPVVVAVDLMVETKLRSLPVVDRRRGGTVLVGIVGRQDLLRCLPLENHELP
ncbi:MAG TPA: CBS domain-containing protein [Methylomirabilota bacterium]|nr:CBS domain-containing protein [Methylomirabilota bacterium]